MRWFDVARKYGFIVPLDGAPDVFLHLRDLDPGVAEALEELAVVSYDVVPYRDKTKAVRLQIVDAAAYAQLVLENQGRTLSVQDAAVELGRLRAIPLPPRAGEDPTGLTDGGRRGLGRRVGDEYLCVRNVTEHTA